MGAPPKPHPLAGMGAGVYVSCMAKKSDIFRMPVRMNRAQLDFVREMADASQPERSARRRALMAEMRDQWFADLARMYPKAIAAIEDALDPAKASVAMRASTAKWLIEQRRSMVPEEREAGSAAAEPGAGAVDKPASEMTIEELDADIARLERAIARRKAEDAETVDSSSIFD